MYGILVCDPKAFYMRIGKKSYFNNPRYISFQANTYWAQKRHVKDKKKIILHQLLKKWQMKYASCISIWMGT